MLHGLVLLSKFVFSILALNIKNEQFNKQLTLNIGKPTQIQGNAWAFLRLLRDFEYYNLKTLIGKKPPSYETSVLTKSMDMDIWVVGTSNELFIKGSYIETKFSTKKNSYWQNSVLCDRSILYFPFYLPQHCRQFCMKILRVQSQYFQLKKVLHFLEKVFVFQKICFKVKVLITFKTSSDCKIKTSPSLRRTILKSHTTDFQKNLCSFSWL